MGTKLLIRAMERIIMDELSLGLKTLGQEVIGWFCLLFGCDLIVMT